MRSHAKAPSWGSNVRKVGRLGWIALVTSAFLLALGAASALAQNSPALTVNGSSEVGVTSAKLEGEVNAEGEAGSPPTYFHFEVSADNGSNEPDGNWIFVGGNPDGEISAPEAEEANPVPVEGIAENLQPATKYFIRLVADNAEFANHVETGAPFPSFTTGAATAPVLTTEPATAVGYSSITLHGSVDPEGGNVNPIGGPTSILWQFEVHPEGQGWSAVGPGLTEISGSDAESSTALPVEAALPPGTLQAGKTYEFRLFAYYLNFSRSAESPAPFESFATNAATAPAVTIEPAGSVAGTTAHFSGQVEVADEDPAFDASCRFEYVNDAKFIASEWAEASQVSCAPDPLKGGEAQPVAVQADPTGLEPHTTYHLRLIATNQGGADAALAPATFTTEAIVPAVGNTFASAIDTESATLEADVNPGGAETTYRFQYTTRASFEASGFAGALETPSATLPADNALHPTSAPISDLEPHTAYRYRAIASNAKGMVQGEDRGFRTFSAPGEASCPNAGLRIGPSVGLPDCRAYEMASPLDKNGGNISGFPRRTRVATDGNAVSYMSRAGFAGTKGLPTNGAEYISRRGSENWSTYPITPQVDAPIFPSIWADSQYVGAFSPDLSRGVFRALHTVPGNTPPNVLNSANLYLGENLGSSGSTLQLLSDSFAPLQPENTEFDPGYLPPIQFADASDDFSHVLFESRRNLTADASGEDNKTYEWVEGQGLRLAGILPDDACATPPCPAAASLAGKGANVNYFINGGEGDFTQLTNTISADGSRIFFTVPAEKLSYGISEYGDLYMREDGATTVQIDASELSAPIPGNPGSSEFQAATPDGSVVFFLSSRKLTDDDVDPPTGEQNFVDLYRYDVEAPAGHRLTLMTPESETPRALFINYVPSISDDGEYVYIEAVKPGETNFDARSLFLLHDGEARFIASKGTSPEGVSWGETGTFQHVPNSMRVSPDGRHVLFGSTDDNGYDLGGHQGLFLYSADSDELVCASCKPGGGAATADAGFFIRGILGKGDSSDQNLPQALSADGRWAFFTTAVALVPEDTNGKLDAYQYDSESGRLALISSGECNCDSIWVGASPSGDDVFFDTAEQLVRADTDNLYDIYDARVNGGLAAQNRLPAVGCEGDACQPVITPSAAQTPASAGFNGPANPQAKIRKHRRSKHKSKRKRHRQARKAAQRRHHARNHGKQG